MTRGTDFFEIRCGMFAEWTDEVCRQFLSFIFIAADEAAPNGLAFGGLTDRLWFRFDMFLVEIIGSRRYVGECLHFGNKTDEKNVRAQINGLLHIRREKGVGAASDSRRAVADAAAVGEIGELIDCVPTLETEVLEQFEISRLTDDGDCETP